MNSCLKHAELTHDGAAGHGDYSNGAFPGLQTAGMYTGLSDHLGILSDLTVYANLTMDRAKGNNEQISRATACGRQVKKQSDA